MSVVAGQITRGPLATSQHRTPGLSGFSEHDEEYKARPFTWSGREWLVLVLAATLVALMVVVLSQLVAPSGIEVPAVTPDEVFVVDPDGAEPIVCIVRAGARRCTPMDLGPGLP